MVNYKFSREINAAFARTLKRRVNAYFVENNLSKNANSQMVTKTIIGLSYYFSIYFIIIFGGINHVPTLFVLWVMMGIGQAFIGTGVMHDVLHGSYTKSKHINNLMQLAIIAIGVEPSTWKIQHNVLHHSYTNVEDADEDIAPRYVLRFTVNQPRRWFHRFQHIYVSFFYSIPIIIWVTAKDFIKLHKYKSLGLIRSDSKFRKMYVGTIFRKLVYLFFFLLIPIYALEVSAGLVICMFLTQLVVTGIILSAIFQTAHIIPSCDIIDLEDGEEVIKENWLVHQLLTTTNYAMKNKFITWFFGSLNYQVEHHLFPNICHIHYPAIAPIVQATTAEYGIPYHAERTFTDAVVKHYKLLKDLGRYDVPDYLSKSNLTEDVHVNA